MCVLVLMYMYMYIFVCGSRLYSCIGDLVMPIPPHSMNNHVQSAFWDKCCAIFSLITVYISGRLSSVGDLKTERYVLWINISWTAPFSLNVTDVDPDVWFSVLIYNVTDKDNPTAVPCNDCINITETYYIFTTEHPSPCHKYNFTIIPYNGVGQGERNKTITATFPGI